MIRVVFVDDETRVLDGLRRTFRSRRGEWDMAFAVGGADALREMERIAADLVITDMRMPEMSGARLLERVSERWPATMRAILSGQTESDAALEAARWAHQFLTKPCGNTQVVELVERAARLQRMVPDRALRAAAGGITRLPCAQEVRDSLGRTLADPACSAATVARLIETDGALAAKTLQLVTTSFFAPPPPIDGALEAVERLGLETLRSLFAADALCSSGGVSDPEFSIEEHQARSLEAAREALLQRARPTGGNLHYLSGLFADLSGLVMAAGGSADLRRVTSPAERRALGPYLLGLWGLPWPLVEAVGARASASGESPEGRVAA